MRALERATYLAFVACFACASEPAPNDDANESESSADESEDSETETGEAPEEDGCTIVWEWSADALLEGPLAGELGVNALGEVYSVGRGFGLDSLYLDKWSPEGTRLWSHVLPGDHSKAQLELGEQGQVYAFAYTPQGPWLAELAPDTGEPLWEQSVDLGMGSPDVLTLTPAGELMVIGKQVLDPDIQVDIYSHEDGALLSTELRAGQPNPDFVLESLDSASVSDAGELWLAGEWAWEEQGDFGPYGGLMLLQYDAEGELLEATIKSEGTPDGLFSPMVSDGESHLLLFHTGEASMQTLEKFGEGDTQWALGKGSWLQPGSEGWASTLDLDGEGRVGLVGSMELDEEGSQPLWTVQLSPEGELLSSCEFAPIDPDTQATTRLRAYASAAGPDGGVAIVGERNDRIWVAYVQRPGF